MPLDVANDEFEHIPQCSLAGDYTGCIEGKIYGLCESALCYGYCEFQGNCACKCHDE